MKQIAGNVVPSLWKAVVSGLLGGGAINLGPVIFPHCQSAICLALGSAVSLFVWGSLHGVGVSSAASPPKGA